VKPRKTAGQHPAIEMGTELALDEARHRMIAITSSCEEGREVVANRLAEEGLLGAPGALDRLRLARGGLAAIVGNEAVGHPAPARVRDSGW